MGIDPGYATLGFGLIEVLNGQIRMIEYGTVETPKELDQTSRIRQTVDDLMELVREFRPDEIALEELFFSKNVTTALKVAEVRGAIFYALHALKLPLAEYKPNQVKNNLCGNGAAPKIQIQKMVQLLLNLEQLPEPDDAADGLAIAICHANHLQQKIKTVQ